MNTLIILKLLFLCLHLAVLTISIRVLRVLPNIFIFFYFSLYTTSFRWSSSICILLITMYIMMESKSILRPHSWISDLWVKTTIGHCYLDRHKTYHIYFIKIELLQLLITLITTTIHTQLLLFLPKEWHHCPSSWGENMYKLDITFISNSYFISKSCQYYYFNTS